MSYFSELEKGLIANAKKKKKDKQKNTTASDDIAPIRPTVGTIWGGGRSFGDDLYESISSKQKKLDEAAEEQTRRKLNEKKEQTRSKLNEETKADKFKKAQAEHEAANKAYSEWLAKSYSDEWQYRTSVSPEYGGATQEEIDAFNAQQQPLLDELKRTSDAMKAAHAETPEGKYDFFNLDLFQKGAFGNGYQAGDVAKAILGTVGDVGLNVFKGIALLGEGLGDAATYGIADIAEAKGNKANADTWRANADKDFIGSNLAPAEEWLDQYSILGNTTTSAASGVGQMAGIWAAGELAAGAGLTAKAVSALTKILMGTSSYGHGVSEARNDGATDAEARAFGLLNAGAEILGESLFDTMGKSAKASGADIGMFDLDDLLAKRLGSLFTSKAWKNASQGAVKASSEGVEESVTGFLQAAAKKMTYMKEEDFWDIVKDENLWEQFFVGSLTGSVVQSVDVHMANKADRDLITGLNDDEQTVVDKLVEDEIAKAEKNGKKVKKGDIEAQITDQLEKGRISVEDIEKVFGGDEYSAYSGNKESFMNSDSFKEYNDNLKESRKLADEYEELKKVKREESTLGDEIRVKEIQQRMDELKARSDELKAKLQPEVNKLNQALGKVRTTVAERVKDGKLAESYRELYRSTQKFEADPSKYKSEAAKKTIQNLIDGGIANNTNEFHEFADFMAKIADDKGVVFDITDNNRLKGTRFEVKGAQVNAFVDENGNITINKDSKKRLNSLVGHEVTHVLEGTAFYNELQTAVKNYAQAKGEWDSRLKSITDLYAKYKPDADPVKELTADLIGDYIFTDKDFVMNLSTKNRGLFEKIYDEIKYMAKIATAGSKEARDLERVRKVFEEAWRASGKITTEQSVNENRSLTNEQVNEANDVLKDVGVEYDATTQTVSHSLSSLMDSFNIETDALESEKFLENYAREEYLRAREEYVDALQKTTGKSREECNRYLDGLFLVGEMIAKDQDRLDYEAAVDKSSWVSNAEYGGSIDFSTLCAKRRLFTGTFDAIQEALPDTVLNENDFLKIRNMLLAKELESPCSMCYVEGSRAKHGEYVAKFLEDYLATDPKWRPQIADFTSTTRLEQTRINHPEAYAAYQAAMNKLAQRKPKEASVRTDYKGEILVAFEDGSSVTIKNENGGIRFNSFSDFEIIHALDCMQVITDMARVGLNGQAYTKVAAFAEAFGNTGLKINLSLVAKGVDENGKLIMDETNGMNYAEAIDIRNLFSENVGTVIVVFNEAQLKAALADDSIDYVLPFHRSQWKKSQYTMMGLPVNTKDFTMHQNDRIKNPATGKPVKLSKIKHTANYVNDLTGKSYEIGDNIMPNQYWDYTKTGRENAQRYLDYINGNGLIPKFSFLLNKVDGKWVLPADSVGDGYYKLLIDFKMYNNDGVGSPQKPVMPEFNMPYITKMLEDYKGGHKSFPVAYDVVDEFVKSKQGFQASLSDNDATQTGGTGYAVYGDKIGVQDYGYNLEDIAPLNEDAVSAEANSEQVSYSVSEKDTSATEKTRFANYAENQIANYKESIAEERKNAKPKKKPSFGAIKRLVSTKAKTSPAYHGVLTVGGKQYLTNNGAIAIELNEPNSAFAENEQLNVEAIKRFLDTANSNASENNYDIDKTDISLIVKQLPNDNNSVVVVDDYIYDVRYVDAVLKAISDPVISLTAGRADQKALLVKGSNGQAIIMPIRLTDGNKNNLRYVYKASEANAIAPDVANPVENVPVESDEALQDDFAPIATQPTSEENLPPATAEAAVEEDISPIRDDNERKWVRTATESEAVNGKIVPEGLDQELIHYEPISNKKTLGNANAMLENMGYDGSVEYLKGQFTNNKVKLNDIALGERLIQEAIKRGDTKTAGDLIVDIAILGTELGQKVQALSIIKRLTPEGQLRMLQRTIQRGKTNKDPAFDNVKLTQEMKDEILNTINEDGSYDQAELNKAVENVKQKIADQMDVTWTDVANAWRYLAMLGNPKTHLRNIVSNVAMAGTVAIKNSVARTLEPIAGVAAKAAGRDMTRTKTWMPATMEVENFAKQTTKDMASVIAGDRTDVDAASIKEMRNVFTKKLGFVGGILDVLSNANSDAMSAEDSWFSRPAFKNALAEYLTANGIQTAEDIQNNPEIVEKAKQYALDQSLEATFRQYSYLANKLNEIEKKNAFYRVGIGAVMPFKKTPINIGKAGLNYSPIGFLKTLTYDANEVRKGNMEASTLIDNLSKNLTGSALTLLGYALAQAGFLHGAGDDDKEGDYDYQLGQQTYSIEIGDKTYSLSWLSPVAMPLFVGANMYEQLVEGKGWNGNVVMETMAQTLDPLSEMSFVSSLNDVLSSYGGGTTEKIAGVGVSAIQNYITQYIPTLTSQIAAAMDDTKRTTKASKDSDFKILDETINQIKYKIPGLRQTLQPALDIWGNEIEQNEDVGMRVVDSFIAPWSEKSNISTSVDRQLKRIYNATGENGVLPSAPDAYLVYKNEKYNMSDEEYTSFKKTYGQTAYKMLDDLFETSTYKKASDDEKAKLVEKVYDYARDEAKRDILEGRDIEYTNSTEDGVPVYKENAIKGAIENDMTPEEYTYSQENPEKYEFLKQSDITYSQYKSFDDDAKDAYSWAFENQSKYRLAETVYGDFPTYYQHKKALDGFDAKDKYGNTVSGLKKKRVFDYINGLPMDAGEKMIMYKSYYKSNDDYNRQIIDYLNKRDDISYQEMVDILVELGFKISADGRTITWD